MKLKFLDGFSKKNSNTKFRENPSSGSRVVLHGRTDMTKLTAAFRNFESARYKKNPQTNLDGNVYNRKGKTLLFGLQKHLLT